MDEILKLARKGSRGKKEAHKDLAGERIVCGEFATKLAIYDVDGAQVIEKHCDKSFKKWSKGLYRPQISHCIDCNFCVRYIS